MDELGRAQYVRVTSYRRDGTPVGTPVWVVRDGDALAIWTPTVAWKVKRIRRNPAVRVAACDYRGNPTGDECHGTAEVLDATGTDRVRRLIGRKYGLMGRLTLLGSRLRRGTAGTVGISIRLAGDARSGE